MPSGSLLTSAGRGEGPAAFTTPRILSGAGRSTPRRRPSRSSFARPGVGAGDLHTMAPAANDAPARLDRRTTGLLGARTRPPWRAIVDVCDANRHARDGAEANGRSRLTATSENVVFSFDYERLAGGTRAKRGRAGSRSDGVTGPARAEAEARSLIEAALAVLRRQGAAGLTWPRCWPRPGSRPARSTGTSHRRTSCSLALFDADNEVVRGRVDAAIDSAPNPKAALVAWIDQQLALAYAPRRSKRTQVLWAEGMRLQHEFPDEFSGSWPRCSRRSTELAAAVGPTARSPTPSQISTCLSIHAVVWEPRRGNLGSERDSDRIPPAAWARESCGRFCLPALDVADCAAEQRLRLLRPRRVANGRGKARGGTARASRSK